MRRLPYILLILSDGAFAAITHFLPMSIATKSLQDRWEDQRKKRHLPEEPEGEDIDLFSRQRMFPHF